MTRSRKQNLLFAPLVLALVFAGCKGESPTAPTQGGGNPGGIIPPSGAVVTVTASTLDLEVDQTTVITANVTQNGAPVPNGTAVEFTTTRGTFADSGTAATLRTTTNGLATVSLSSATAGTAIVSATVNNVTRTSPTITFRARPVTQPKPTTDPTVVSVTPTFGLPTGGEIIRIKGTNFVGRVRVFFDIPGEAQPREAFPVFQDATTIDVVTPNVQLAPGQELVVPIRVVVDADTVNQKTVAAPTPFTFRTVVFTPSLVTASPNSGPITGGTRVTLFGNGFQAPVQVLFGNAEARVVGDIRFDSIIVETPAARDIAGIGTSGPVAITVVNINSGTRTTLAAAFNYTPTMAITAGGPNIGPTTGGTRVTIEGFGLDGRLAVSLAGIAAQVISATGTRVIVESSPVALTSCADVIGPITVTNIDTGLSAVGPNFTYRVVKPAIIGVSPSTATAGGSITVVVANAQPGLNRFTIVDRSVFPSGAVLNPDGSTTFTLALPTNFTFPTEACLSASGVAGTRNANIAAANVTYLNVPSTCTDTATGALVITPSDTTCRIPPPNPVATVNPAGTPGSCANYGNVVAAGGAVGTTTITITNSTPTGGLALNVSSATISGTNGTFAITPSAATSIPPGGSSTFTVNVDPTAVGPANGTVTFTTNDPNRATIQVCVQGTGT